MEEDDNGSGWRRRRVVARLIQ
nr:hypothetical protein [Tanacetum cinerariifolium]